MKKYTSTFKAVQQIKKLFTLTILISFLAACGSKLDGTYTTPGKNPFFELTFKSNGTAISKSMGVETEMKYEVEDKAIKLRIAGDSSKLIVKIKDDGSLDFPHPLIGVLIKKK